MKIKNEHKDLVGYALKAWFTTLILAPLNYFLIIIYLFPEARLFTQAEGLRQCFYVWIAALYGYFPTLILFIILQNYLKNKLPYSSRARMLLILSGSLFTGLNVFVAGSIAGFPGLIWCASVGCALAFTGAFAAMFILAAGYFLPWD